MPYIQQPDGTWELCERRMVRCRACEGTGVWAVLTRKGVIPMDCQSCKGACEVLDPDDLAYPQQPGESDRDFNERLAVHADSRRK